MDQLSSALAVLTAMITPAVLVMASGTLILSTSNRLGRVVDRVRKLSADAEEFAHVATEVELLDERRRLVLTQLGELIKRAKLLQRSLTMVYVSGCLFISTSVAIGAVGVSGTRYAWIPVGLGIAGACALLYASMLLILEARLAFRTLRLETEFIWKLGTLHAPESFLKERSKRGARFRFRRASDKTA